MATRSDGAHQILQVVRRMAAQRGRTPEIREIAKEMGATAPATRARLETLAINGFMERIYEPRGRGYTCRYVLPTTEGRRRAQHHHTKPEGHREIRPKGLDGGL